MIRLRFRAGRDLVCRQAVELVTDYIEGALSPPQRRRFEAHVAGCPDCPEYVAQMRAIIALAGSITPDDLSPRIRSELISLYHQWLADEGLPDSGRRARRRRRPGVVPLGKGEPPAAANRKEEERERSASRTCAADTFDC